MKKRNFLFHIFIFIFILTHSAFSLVLDDVTVDENFNSNSKKNKPDRVTIKFHNYPDDITGNLKMTVNDVILADKEYSLTNSRLKSNYYILIDNSGSMKVADLNVIKNNVNYIIQRVNPSDKIEITTVNDSMNTIYPLAPYRMSASNQVANIRREGNYSRIYDAIRITASDIYEKKRVDKNSLYYLLFFSDGEEIASDTTAPELLQVFPDVPLYYFCYSSDYKPEPNKPLVTLAEKNGKFYKYLDTTLIDSLFFSNENRYTLIFDINKKHVLEYRNYLIELSKKTSPDDKIVIDLRKYFDKGIHDDMVIEPTLDKNIYNNLKGNLRHDTQIAYSALSKRETTTTTLTKNFANSDKPNNPKQDFANHDKSSNSQQNIANSDKPSNPQQDFANPDKPSNQQQDFANHDKPSNQQQDFANPDKSENSQQDIANPDKSENSQQNFANSDKSSNSQQDFANSDKPNNPKQDFANPDKSSNQSQNVANHDKSSNSQQDFANPDKPSNQSQNLANSDKPNNQQQDFANPDKSENSQQDFANSDKSSNSQQDFANSDKPSNPQQNFANHDKPSNSQQDFANSDKPSNSQQDFANHDKSSNSQQDFANPDKSENSQQDIANSEKPNNLPQNIENSDKSSNQSQNLANSDKPSNSQLNVANHDKPNNPQQDIANSDKSSNQQQDFANQDKSSNQQQDIENHDKPDNSTQNSDETTVTENKTTDDGNISSIDENEYKDKSIGEQKAVKPQKATKEKRKSHINWLLLLLILLLLLLILLMIWFITWLVKKIGDRRPVVSGGRSTIGIERTPIETYTPPPTPVAVAKPKVAPAKTSTKMEVKFKTIKDECAIEKSKMSPLKHGQKATFIDQADKSGQTDKINSKITIIEIYDDYFVGASTTRLMIDDIVKIKNTDFLTRRVRYSNHTYTYEFVPLGEYDIRANITKDDDVIAAQKTVNVYGNSESIINKMLIPSETKIITNDWIDGTIEGKNHDKILTSDKPLYLDVIIQIQEGAKTNDYLIVEVKFYKNKYSAKIVPV